MAASRSDRTWFQTLVEAGCSGRPITEQERWQVGWRGCFKQRGLACGWGAWGAAQEGRSREVVERRRRRSIGGGVVMVVVVEWRWWCGGGGGW